MFQVGGTLAARVVGGGGLQTLAVPEMGRTGGDGALAGGIICIAGGEGEEIAPLAPDCSVGPVGTNGTDHAA